jgi:hypothetical protein
MARSRDISKVLSSNSTLATDAEVASTYQTKASAGLILLHSADLSGITTVNIDSIFSATYRTYKLILTGKISTGDADVYIKFRKAGVTTTDSNYNRQYLHASGTTGSGLLTGQSFARLGNIGTSQSGFEAMIYSPFLSESTTTYGQSGTSTNTSNIRIEAFTHTTAESYDGIQLAPTSNAFTGRLTIFGVNQ